MYESHIEQLTDDVLNEKRRNDEYIYFRILNSIRIPIHFISDYVLFLYIFDVSELMFFFFNLVSDSGIHTITQSTLRMVST